MVQRRSWGRVLFSGLAAVVMVVSGRGSVGSTSAPVPNEKAFPDERILARRGAVYYVAPTGSDSNPGTEAQPWRTIQKAAHTLVAGDTVYIKAGTYRERVVAQNSGSPGHYITYAAYPGDTVTIDGTGVSISEWGGLFDVSYSSYIKVSGLRVINSAGDGIFADGASHIMIEKNYTYKTASSGIGIWNSNNIIIDSNEVELACSNGMQECITVAGTDTFEVRNNHVHNGISGYRKEGIDAKDGSRNGKVYRNHVHHTEAVGIYVDAWDKHTYNIQVFQNVVHDILNNNGFSLASESGGLLENVSVYNNIAYNNKFLGLGVSMCCPDLAAHHPLKNIRIINNTFYNNGVGEWGGGIGVEPADMQSVVIRNNICSQNLSFQIAVDAGIPTGNLTIDHNLIDGYRDSEGEIYGSAYVEGDPLFANPVGADFHLRANSPAIDKGSAINAPGDDFDGHARPLDGNGDGIPAYDIGAYEVLSYPRYAWLPIVLR